MGPTSTWVCSRLAMHSSKFVILPSSRKTRCTFPAASLSCLFDDFTLVRPKYYQSSSVISSHGSLCVVGHGHNSEHMYSLTIPARPVSTRLICSFTKARRLSDMWPSQNACTISGPFVEIAVVMNPSTKHTAQSSVSIRPKPFTQAPPFRQGLQRQESPHKAATNMRALKPRSPSAAICTI